MKATYKNYTGEVIKLERGIEGFGPHHLYNLTIRAENGAAVSFENIPLSGIKFSGADVSFGG